MLASLLAAALLLLPSSAQAQDLADLLADGDLVLIEHGADGRVARVKTWSWFPQDVDTVWSTIVAWEAYSDWMPRVKEVEAGERGDDWVDLTWTIKVPGPAVRFTGRYQMDAAARTIRGTWRDGALEGSSWSWKLEADGSGTRMERVLKTTAATDSFLLRQFDDRWHTLEYGINAATPIVEARGLRERLQTVAPR
ncbi:MAG: SRPBCC family protein [Alphaproteobacteria bacterium]|nr:SRPBCC family protein [Alphaproteobacteria bacterium]